MGLYPVIEKHLLEVIEKALQKKDDHEFYPSITFKHFLAAILKQVTISALHSRFFCAVKKIISSRNFPTYLFEVAKISKRNFEWFPLLKLVITKLYVLNFFFCILLYRFFFGV